MKKILTYITVSLIACMGTHAEVISPESALKRVEQSGKIISNGLESRALSSSIVKTLKDKNGVAALYVFDNPGNNGFMIVSADDNAVPLLGYSDTGYIDFDNLPPALEYWLGEYQRQIEFARENNLTRSSNPTSGVTLPSTWTAVTPLLTTNWNQDAPYNDLCPVDKGMNSFTGCVATSMAQVMNYHKYPTKGKGEITYTTRTLRRNLSMNFGATTFDWNNMLNGYTGNYTEAQANAVATLMKACGYSVQMDYTSNQSGAVSGIIPSALVNYFDYDLSVRYFTREMYSFTEWATLIYNNLKSYGPVIYDGTGTAGGHSWVCDGYNGNGMFHMNWGWGGTSNGYYSLDALSPDALGIGGGGGDFNYGQGGVFNIQPNKNSGTAQSNILLYGTLTGVLNGGSIILTPTGVLSPGWGYQGLGTFPVSFGVGYAKADSNGPLTFIPETNGGEYNLTGGSYIPVSSNLAVNTSRFSLENGVKYKVVAAYKPRNGQWSEIPVGVGFYNYFYLTKNGTKYTIENMTPLQFTSSGVTLNSPLYYNSAVEVSTSFSNPNNIEITRSVAFALVDSKDKLSFVGTPMLLSIAPGNSVTYTWATTLTRQSGISAVTQNTDFYPALYDTENKVVFYKSSQPVTMMASAGVLDLEISMSVKDAPILDYTINDVNVYDVDNARNFNVVTDVEVSNGYLADQLYLGIYRDPYEDEDSRYIYLSYYLPMGEYTFMNKGESNTWTNNVNFPYAQIGSAYYMGLLNSTMSLINGEIYAVIEITGIGESGVESIEADRGEIMFLIDKASRVVNVTGGENGIAGVDAYYLNGMKAPVKVQYINGNASVDLSGLGKGFVILTATDNAGNRKTVKTPL